MNCSLKLFCKLGPTSKQLATLNMFAYDTIDEYNKNKDKYLALKPSQLKKLELLTIADMASKSSHVEYADIMHKL